MAAGQTDDLLAAFAPDEDVALHASEASDIAELDAKV
jgi:hypothetical protein